MLTRPYPTRLHERRVWRAWVTGFVAVLLCALIGGVAATPASAGPPPGPAIPTAPQSPGPQPTPTLLPPWPSSPAPSVTPSVAPSAPTVPVTPTPTPKDDCGFTDVVCKVSKAVREALSTGIGWGVQGIVNLVVQGEVVLLSWLAKLIFTHTAIGAPNEAFYTVYNSIAGYLIILVFVFFLLSTIINGLRVSGPGPLSTLGGLVRAMLGISFAGGIAFVIVQAWDTATNGLIDANSSQPWDPSILVKSITALSNGAGTAFLALCIGVLSIFGLLLLFIMLLFRSLLTTGAALLGAMAMTGQVMPETRHWGRRWFWTVNALASSKFFIAALWIYGSRTAYEADSLIACLQGLLIIWLMVFTPGILMRLTTMWDGYLSDVNARAIVSTPGSASDIGEGIGREYARQSANTGDSGDGDAAEQMSQGASDIATTPGQGRSSDQDTSDALDDADTDTNGAPSGEDDPAAGAENSDDGVGDPAAEADDSSETDTGGAAPAQAQGDADDTTSNTGASPDPASGSGEVKGGETAAQAEAGADGAAQGVAQQTGDESAVGAPAGGSDAASGSPGATTAGGVSPGGEQAGAPTSSGSGGQPGAGGADGGSASGGAGPNTGGSGAGGANSSGGSSPGGAGTGGGAGGAKTGGGSAGGAGAGAGVEDVAIVAL